MDNASPRDKDMTRIAFLSSRDNHFRLLNVFTMTLSDHAVRQVTPISSGKEIFFSSDRDWGEDEDIFNCHIMSENGENVSV